MNTGDKLWRRAKRVIPGGNHLLSKRPDMFLPQGWPNYFLRSKGCEVWDLDGNRYLDVGYMGVGTNILGYGHPAVDAAVIDVVNSGNLTSLNGPEEVLLAEALIEMHPWADMARFTRSGGEAGAVAVRIARAATGKDVIAFCGYHGWHDWYLSANLAEDSSLDGHLLPGLSPAGVPRGLLGTAVPWTYNDLTSLEALLLEGNVAAVYMEVERSTPPSEGFLAGVRQLAHRHNAVLVFDECTSGFRTALGGHHLTFGIEPDMAIFGKTLGNGYAINAVIGREAVMQAAQSTFISSTFWTERIGPAAALASLKVMRAENVPSRVNTLGLSVASRWDELAVNCGLLISISGLPAISTYAFADYDPLQAKTFITQAMLEEGFLAPPALYLSIAHSEDVLDKYFAALEKVFNRLARLQPEDLITQLPFGSARAGFQRLA